MAVLQINSSLTFEQLHDAFLKKPKIIVLIGGSRSGKTWAIMQLLMIIAFREDVRITAWRLKRTWTKPTIWADFISMLKSYNLYDKKKSNETELKYKFKSSTVEFGGLDDAQKIHGLTSDIVWINEVVEIDKNNFDQLEMRCNGVMFLDCNPTEEESWVYDLKKREDVIFLHSTHLNNSFLGETIRAKILSYEPTTNNIALGTADAYKWSVYGLGKAAHREGLIFPNFNEIAEMPKDARIVGVGLDFGFYPDPAAAVKVGIYNGKLVLDELFYENELVNIDLNTGAVSIEQRLKENGIDKTLKILADSAASASIAELRGRGFNVEKCSKGHGSILEGIEVMQRFAPFYVTERSINVIKELKNYTRKKDFASGKFLKEPVDNFNHLIDATRYCVTDFIKIKINKGIRKATL